MNLFAKSNIKSDRQQLNKIKNWVYQTLNIDREMPVSLNQLQCHEPDCPPVETVIAVMTNPPQQYKIHKPLSQITEADINQIKEYTQRRKAND